jgi:hypothetical protein
MSRFVMLVVTTLLTLFSATATSAETSIISCDGSPRDAKLELPAPANEWAQVVCTQFGHLLIPQDGWYWGRDPTPMPAFIPADLLNTTQMRKVGNSIYFRDFKLRQLSEADALKRHELFYKWIGKERTSIYPEVWELIGTNESGKSFTLNIFKRPTDGGWGIACIPECDMMKPFVIVKTKK